MANAPAPPPPPAPKPSVHNVTVAPVVATVAKRVTALADATPEQERAAAEAERRLAALATADVSQANAATGVYGVSGCGKTSLTATAIEYGWETYHRIGRVYAADLGGYGNKLIKLAKLGIAQVWNLRNHIEPFETMELASLGYWPEKVLDPITGYADPYVRLVPPEVRRWIVHCPNDHPFPPVTTKRLLDSFQQVCPTCRQMTTLQNWARVEEIVAVPAGFKHVGLYCYDSGSSMQDWAMEDLAGKAAREDISTLSGDKNALRGINAKVVSGGMTFGTNSMQHYGFAQLRMQSWIANSRRIPRQVVPPVWTFLEERGKDEGGIMTIFGPKISGSARTSDVPSWLGNCLYAARELNPSGVMVHRLYTSTHSKINEGNIPHLAKHRGEPGAVDAILEDDPTHPFEKCSLKYFFVQLEASLQKSLTVAVEQYPDAPALQPFTDDQDETVVSTSTASVAMERPRQIMPAGIAGAVATGMVPQAMPVGAPAPPVAAPPPPGRPPIPGPVPVPVSQSAPAAPVPVSPASPSPKGEGGGAQVQHGVPPGAAGSVVPAAPPPPAPRPVTPPAGGNASPAQVPPAAAVSQPAGQAAAGTTPAAGGAPVRPPIPPAVSRPRANAAGRPPVPPPAGPKPT